MYRHILWNHHSKDPHSAVMNKQWIHVRAVCENRKQNCEFQNFVWKSEWMLHLQNI